MCTELNCLHEGRLGSVSRRDWLRRTLALGASAAAVGLLGAGRSAGAVSFSREQRDAMTPDDVITMLREGNQRFRSGAMRTQDFLEQKRASASGQYPAAMVLSCIDSRAPAEIIMDTGIGDIFNARIAGNVATPGLLGSMEFGCAVAGAKLLMVMGHTACGAIAGSIQGVELGNLTGVLERIRPAVEATPFQGERISTDRAFVNAVAHTNVLNTIEVIRQQSPILAGLADQGKIKIVGAMYNLEDGQVNFLT